MHNVLWRCCIVVCLCLVALVAWGDRESIVSSDDGAYLVFRRLPVTTSGLEHDSGLWLYTVAARRWQRMWPRPANGSWLPDSRHLVIEGQGEHATYFKRLTPDGASALLPTLPRSSIEWKVFPNGSGMVATTHPMKGEGIEIWRLAFSDSSWHRVASYPWKDSDMGTGDHLALRNVGDDWVLSCHERGPSDSRSLWVNLTTGKYLLGDEGDPLYEYSPDGQHAIANAGRMPGSPICLWSAYSWPQAEQTVLHDPLILPDAYQIFSGNWRWSPDGNAVVGSRRNESRTETPQNKYVVIGLDGKDISSGQGRIRSWIGSERLLVEDDAAGSWVIRSIAQQPDVLIATPPWGI